MRRAPSVGSQDLGQLGLAHAGLALEQQRTAQPQAQEDGGDQGAVGDVVEVTGRRPAGLRWCRDGRACCESSVPAACYRAAATSRGRKGQHWPPEPDVPRAGRWRSSSHDPQEPESDAILPFGDRLDTIAQERFNRTDWIELAAAVLLALATVTAAWSAYQATRWGGVQANAYSAAAAKRTEATQQNSLYAAQVADRCDALDQLAGASTSGRHASVPTSCSERFRRGVHPRIRRLAARRCQLGDPARHALHARRVRAGGRTAGEGT